MDACNTFVISAGVAFPVVIAAIGNIAQAVVAGTVDIATAGALVGVITAAIADIGISMIAQSGGGAAGCAGLIMPTAARSCAPAAPGMADRRGSVAAGVTFLVVA